MRYLKYLVLMLALVALPSVHSQAQVSVSAQVGPVYGGYSQAAPAPAPAYDNQGYDQQGYDQGNPDYDNGGYAQAPVYNGGYAYNAPPVCQWGFYPYYPYACAPYGYYGPQWFVSGVFIGAGPWANFYYLHPSFYRPYYFNRGFGGHVVVGNGFHHFGGERAFVGNGFRGNESRGNREVFRGGNNGYRGVDNRGYNGGRSYNPGRSYNSGHTYNSGRSYGGGYAHGGSSYAGGYSHGSGYSHGGSSYSGGSSHGSSGYSHGGSYGGSSHGGGSSYAHSGGSSHGGGGYSHGGSGHSGRR